MNIKHDQRKQQKCTIMTQFAEITTLITRLVHHRILEETVQCATNEGHEQLLRGLLVSVHLLERLELQS